MERIRAGFGLAVFYLVARSSTKEPIGVLPVYPATGPLPPAISPAAVFGVEWTSGWYLGSPGLSPAVIPIAPGASSGPVRAALARAALELAVRAAVEYACFPLLDADLLGTVTPLIAPERRLVVHREEAYLDITFDSLDGYLRNHGPDRRKKLRKERRRFRESGLRLAHGDLLAEHRRLAPLLHNVESRYGVQEPVEAYEAYLASIARVLGGDTRCLVAYDGDEPVAFTVVWARGPVWRVRCWGCDYMRTAGSYAYFNLCVYEPVALAAEAGAERLFLGECTLGAKRRRGAQTRVLTWLAVPARGPVIASAGVAG